MIFDKTIDKDLVRIAKDKFSKFSDFNLDTDRLILKDSKYFGTRLGYFCNNHGEIDSSKEKLTGIAFYVWKDKKQIEVHNFDGIFVHPIHKGEGKGRELIEIMESIAVETDCGFIKVNNVGNPNFWKHMGYSQIKGDKYYNLVD